MRGWSGHHAETAVISASVRRGELSHSAAFARVAELPLDQPLYAGYDVGRKRDLSALWVLGKNGDVFWTRMLRVMDRVNFTAQEDLLALLMRHGGVVSASTAPENVPSVTVGILSATDADADRYVGEMVRSAELVGLSAEDVPHTLGDLRDVSRRLHGDPVERGAVPLFDHLGVGGGEDRAVDVVDPRQVAAVQLERVLLGAARREARTSPTRPWPDPRCQLARPREPGSGRRRRRPEDSVRPGTCRRQESITQALCHPKARLLQPWRSAVRP